MGKEEDTKLRPGLDFDPLQDKTSVSAVASNDRVMPVVGGKIEIIYKHNKPYGIRDASGFLFFFTDVNKYTGQEKRYRQEIEQQFRLADYLLDALKKA